MDTVYLDHFKKCDIKSSANYIASNIQNMTKIIYLNDTKHASKSTLHLLNKPNGGNSGLIPLPLFIVHSHVLSSQLRHFVSAVKIQRVL